MGIGSFSSITILTLNWNKLCMLCLQFCGLQVYKKTSINATCVLIQRHWCACNVEAVIWFFPSKVNVVISATSAGLQSLSHKLTFLSLFSSFFIPHATAWTSFQLQSWCHIMKIIMCISLREGLLLFFFFYSINFRFPAFPSVHQNLRVSFLSNCEVLWLDLDTNVSQSQTF